MTTDKIAIAGYFTESEKDAIVEYADKHRMNSSEAISVLVGKALSQGSKPSEKTPRLQIVAERLELLEKTVDSWISTIFRAMESNEKLEKHIACLQSEIDLLEQKIKDEATKLSK